MIVPWILAIICTNVISIVIVRFFFQRVRFVYSDDVTVEALNNLMDETGMKMISYTSGASISRLEAFRVHDITVNSFSEARIIHDSLQNGRDIIKQLTSSPS